MTFNATISNYERLGHQVDVFIIMAKDLFIMTGEVMSRTGATLYLINYFHGLDGAPE
jgi:hypothetical protein